MAYEPQPYSAQPARTSTLAIVSLIAGVVGLFVIPILGSLVAVITGHMAKNEIKNSGGQISGDGLATGGLITGYLGLALGLLIICAVVAIFALGFGSLLFFGASVESGAILGLLGVI